MAIDAPPGRMSSTPAASTSRRRSSAVRAVLRSPMGASALVVVVLLLVLMAIGPLLWGSAAAVYHPNAISQGPSAHDLVGTDSAGRNIFLRVLVATRLSVGLTLIATVIAVVAGGVLGSLPSLVGRRLGRVVSAVIDTSVAFPSLLLAIFFATIFGVGAKGAVLALGFAGVPWFARLTATLAASVMGRDYVAASRVLGVGRLRVLVRHVLPNIAEPLTVNATIGAAANLLAFAGLSFLGLGVQAPSYDWGELLLQGINGIYLNPWAALAPGVAIALAGLAFNLVGEIAAQALGGRRPSRRPAREARIAATDEPQDADGLILDARQVTVRFAAADGWSVPVRGVDLVLRRDESVGVVGESGSGKSLTALAVARLIEDPVDVDCARLVFGADDLRGASPRQVRALLKDRLAVVFQNPMSSLNPVMRVGRQLAEVATEHQHLSRRAAWTQSVTALTGVRIPDAARRARQLPHQFSGGMRQRAMIAMGLMGSPELIVADEPTTALDVTVQREVLRLLAAVRAEHRATLLMISHDIAVVAGMCDRLLVMYAGRVVEELACDGLRERAGHPYTRALFAALPDMQTPRDQPLATIPGRPPNPAQLPAGCAFAPRCAAATQHCLDEDPQLRPLDTSSTHRIACWHPQLEASRPVGSESVR